MLKGCTSSLNGVFGQYGNQVVLNFNHSLTFCLAFHSLGQNYKAFLRIARHTLHYVGKMQSSQKCIVHQNKKIKQNIPSTLTFWSSHNSHQLYSCLASKFCSLVMQLCTLYCTLYCTVNRLVHTGITWNTRHENIYNFIIKESGHTHLYWLIKNEYKGADGLESVLH